MRDSMDVSGYAAAAAAHGAATESGDHRAANRQYSMIVRALRRLRAADAQWVESLSGLLIHPNAHVRLWAASHLLASPVTSRAQEVLREIAAQSGIAALNAAMTLRQWEAGELQVDDEP